MNVFQKSQVRDISKITVSERKQLACAIFPSFSDETINFLVPEIHLCFSTGSKLYSLRAAYHDCGVKWLKEHGFIWIDPVQRN